MVLQRATENALTFLQVIVYQSFSLFPAFFQVRDNQELRVNGVAPPDEPLESFKPSRSLKDIGFVHDNIFSTNLAATFDEVQSNLR